MVGLEDRERAMCARLEVEREPAGLLGASCAGVRTLLTGEPGGVRAATRLAWSCGKLVGQAGLFWPVEIVVEVAADSRTTKKRNYAL